MGEIIDQRRGEENIMSEREASQQKTLEIGAFILIRCFIGGIFLLAIWFVSFTFAGDWIYGLHSRWFMIPRESFDAIHYAGMAFTKILLMLFFLIPYIVIRVSVKKKTSGKR